jgi:hypothetical protein
MSTMMTGGRNVLLERHPQEIVDRLPIMRPPVVAQNE